MIEREVLPPQSPFGFGLLRLHEHKSAGPSMCASMLVKSIRHINALRALEKTRGVRMLDFLTSEIANAKEQESTLACVLYSAQLGVAFTISPGAGLDRFAHQR